MGPTDADVPLRSLIFDAAVVAAGAIAFLGAVLALFDDPGAMHPLVLFGLPLIVLMSFFPLVLTHTGGGIEIGFESAVLVVLVCLADAGESLSIWCVGVLISQLLTRKRPIAKAFNIGLGALGGALAVLTITLPGTIGDSDGAEVAAVGAGCVVYFACDYVLSGVSIALEHRGGVIEELIGPSAPAALAIFVAIDSLGYLAALVFRELPPWSGLLLAVPLVTILVAARVHTRGNEHRRRLAALFRAAADAQTLQTGPAVLDAVRRHARDIVMTTVDLREEPPGPGELGAQLTSSPGGMWLVTPERSRARASSAADAQALAALVAVADEAFARIGLVGEMGHLARHDALTGLANRALFLDRVEHAVALGRRSGRSLAVVFIDLDGFKAINDRFGHDAGDQLLIVVARRVVACVREADTVARLGGDEFAVLVEDVPNLAHVERMCRRLLTAMLPDIELAGHMVTAPASLGVAYSTEDDDASSLLRNADMAMYHAKTLGKGRYAVYEPSLREESVRKLELIEALRRDIDLDRLVVHYQPLMDLETDRIDGLEALVRWRRGDLLVGPDTFIGLAEESGLIGLIGEHVLRHVVADAPALLQAAGVPISVAVNVSASQLEPGLVDTVSRATAALGEVGLVLEMTENVLIGDDETTSAVLHDLVAAGAVLAIDDFGVGFSSIGYLQHLPVQVLKVDRSFTADVDSDERASALVEAMTLMATALGLRVVAEGIERPGQLDRLRSVGCTVGQGFLLGRPVVLADACSMLRAARPVELQVEVG